MNVGECLRITWHIHQARIFLLTFDVLISFLFIFFVHEFDLLSVIILKIQCNSYEQQSLSVNNIFPPLPIDTMPKSSVLIKFSGMLEKNEDDDSCFTDDEGLQFGEIEY